MFWVYVSAANNGTSITDAVFSASYSWNGGGLYLVYAENGAYISVSAPNYQTGYIQADTGGMGNQAPSTAIFSLTYIGGWPQTY